MLISICPFCFNSEQMSLNRKSSGSNRVNLSTPNVEVNVNQNADDPEITSNFDLFKLTKKFKERQGRQNESEPHALLDFVQNEMRWIDETKGEVMSAEKKGSSAWKAAVKGRITETYVHSAQATTAKHTNEFLVSKILGYGGRVTRSETMSQNIKLKEKVLHSIHEMWSQPEHNVQRCGLFMRAEYPIFAATADAITENYAYKVMTSDSQATFKRLNAGKFSESELNELNFMMHMIRRAKMYIFVVHPSTKLVNTIALEYDMSRANEIIVDAQNFWNREVFPLVLKA